jgi:hypothetical protein
MTKHTPGPWHDPRGSVAILSVATGEKIAEITALRCPVYKAKGGTRNAEIAANARLIARAPDLLEALREIAGGTFDGPCREIALAAIAKVEEREPQEIDQ